MARFSTAAIFRREDDVVEIGIRAPRATVSSSMMESTIGMRTSIQRLHLANADADVLAEHRVLDHLETARRDRGFVPALRTGEATILRPAG